MGRKATTEDLSAAEIAALGERLQIVVAACGSRADAARIAGVTPQQIGRVVTGVSIPSLPTLTRLTKATGFSLDWVLTGIGPQLVSEPRWVTVDDAEMRESERSAGEALAGASETKDPFARLRHLMTYVRFWLGPRMRRLYSQARLPLSDDYIEQVIGHAVDLLGEGEPDPEVRVDHWHVVLAAIEQAHRDAVGWTLAHREVSLAKAKAAAQPSAKSRTSRRRA